jgi:hypothetical protein
MPLAAYPDSGWFIRTLRIFPVVAIAACAGGAIGGYIVFAIDGALAPPPSADDHATGAAIPAKPFAIVRRATPDPSFKTSAPQLSAPQPPALQASAPPTAQPRPVPWPHASWSDKVLRAQKIAPSAPAPAAMPELGQGEAQKNAATDGKDNDLDSAAAPAEAAHAAALRRAHAARKRERELSAAAAAAAREAGDRAYGGLYDYYGATTQGDAAGARYNTRRRAIVRSRPAGQTWSAPSWNGGGFYRNGRQ